ncbi:thioredoxin-dependent thiol peroxidase [Thorsellia kenyensis]|uniref:thioredoxin-dependent peroxiredoxin n=1 Tax=Thorsellia kenyensis TaxID=1549888 RepID=A0ABV6C7E5_9GAMM
MSPLKPGDKAPNFEALNQNNELVKLTDLRGKKVLIYFYPKAMTPGCTVQASHLRDNLADFIANGVDVIGISIDTPDRLAKFIVRDNLNFTLLSDPDHKITEAFGVWGEKKFMGKVFDGIHRISFLIDEEGTIIECFDKFKTSDHHEVVLNRIKTL